MAKKTVVKKKTKKAKKGSSGTVSRASDCYAPGSGMVDPGESYVIRNQRRDYDTDPIKNPFWNVCDR